MRPYIIETCFIFAAGLCVGAWLNERRHMEENTNSITTEDAENKAAVEPVKQEKKKKGWFVSLSNGKLIVDPSGKKRFFFF